jgi:hypothetical protein
MNAGIRNVTARRFQWHHLLRQASIALVRSKSDMTEAAFAEIELQQRQ